MLLFWVRLSCSAFCLFVLPFVSNKGERSPLRRPWSFAVVLIAILMIGTLWVAGENAPWSPNFQAQPLQASVVNSNDVKVQTGAKLFNSKGCQYCHTIAGDGGQRGPNLNGAASGYPQSNWLPAS